jgi:phosphoglycolate phosphatase
LVTIRCSSPGQDPVLFQNIHAVLFDKDGTLANSEDYLRNLAQRRARLVDAQVPGVQDPLLLAFGVEGTQINPAGLQAVGNRQENRIAAAAYVAETGRSWYQALEIVTMAFEEADRYLPDRASQTPWFGEGLPHLQALKQQGVKVAVVSGDQTENLDCFVEHYQLQPYIDLTWGADRAPAKPDPACFQAVCAQLGVDPAATLMVGDATSDMAMAQAAGAAGCIGVQWGWSIPVTIDQADGIITQWSGLEVIPTV